MQLVHAACLVFAQPVWCSHELHGTLQNTCNLWHCKKHKQCQTEPTPPTKHQYKCQPSLPCLQEFIGYFIFQKLEANSKCGSKRGTYWRILGRRFKGFKISWHLMSLQVIIPIKTWRNQDSRVAQSPQAQTEPYSHDYNHVISQLCLGVQSTPSSLRISTLSNLPRTWGSQGFK